MRSATRSLREELIDGRVNRSLFNEKQLSDIYKEKEKITGLTWHHHQDLGRMQLIPKSIHDSRGHVGGMNVWPIDKSKK